MRIELKNLMGADGTSPTFAQQFGISFDHGADWVAEAQHLVSEGRESEARVILEGLVTLNPRSSAYWFALGTVYEKQELVDDAVQAYSQATLREPRHTEAWFRLGVLKLKRGDVDSIDTLRTVLKDTRAENADFVARAKSIVSTSRAA